MGSGDKSRRPARPGRPAPRAVALDAAPLHPEAIVWFTGLDSTKPITVAK